MTFSPYEALVQQVLKSSGKTRSELPTMYAMLFGASAGVTLWLGAYPFDIVKSRMVNIVSLYVPRRPSLLTYTHTPPLSCSKPTR
jgi:hypothetical protein